MPVAHSTYWATRWQPDLLVTTGFALLSLALVSGIVPQFFSMLPIIIPLILFIPGYTMTIVLFPRCPKGNWEEDITSFDRTIDGVERMALAFGLTIASLPLVAISLLFTPWGITQETVIGALALLTLLGSVVGAGRRSRLGLNSRYIPRPHHMFQGERASIAVSVTLALTLILAVSVFAFTITAPQTGETSTDLYVLSPNEDGDLVASGYPESLTTDESAPLTVGVGNNEQTSMQYALVVTLEELDDDGSVEESDVLAEESFNLEHGDTWEESLELSPTMTGENLRISFLLFEDEPSAIHEQWMAYRHVHIWIDVPE